MKLHPFLLLTAIPILVAAPPPRVTDEELDRFDHLVKVKETPDLGAAADLEKAEALSEASARRMADFLTSVNEPSLISQLDAPIPVTKEDEDPLKGLFEPEKDTLLISCSKGIYLDGESYEIDYLGQVKIEGKGMVMTCDKQLKALFHPPKEKDKENGPLAKFGGFGDLKQFIASGNVRVNGRTEEGQKVYIGGDDAVYEMSKDGELENSTITFRGKKIGFMFGDLTDKEAADTSYGMTSVSDEAWIKASVRGQNLFVEWSKTGWITKIRPAKSKDKE